jgi:hypothetical protein
MNVKSFEGGKMGAKSDKEPKSKKPYLKPKVVRVELTPEEVVLGACKSSGGGRTFNRRVPALWYSNRVLELAFFKPTDEYCTKEPISR